MMEDKFPFNTEGEINTLFGYPIIKVNDLPEMEGEIICIDVEDYFGDYGVIFI